MKGQKTGISTKGEHKSLSVETHSNGRPTYADIAAGKIQGNIILSSAQFKIFSPLFLLLIINYELYFKLGVLRQFCFENLLYIYRTRKVSKRNFVGVTFFLTLFYILRIPLKIPPNKTTRFGI